MQGVQTYLRGRVGCFWAGALLGGGWELPTAFLPANVGRLLEGVGEKLSPPSAAAASSAASASAAASGVGVGVASGGLAWASEISFKLVAPIAAGGGGVMIGRVI